jgi:hypothetical protein
VAAPAVAPAVTTVRAPVAPKVYHTFNIPGTPPAMLAGIPYLTQVNLSTPPVPDRIGAALAAPGPVFFDTEMSVESGDVNAWGQNLRIAVQQVHAKQPRKEIGVFCLPMGANASPYWQIVYEPMVRAARQVRQAGYLDGVSWASLCMYCDPAALTDHIAQAHWVNGLLSQAAAIQASGLKAFGFLSPYDAAGNAVCVELFGEACILARGLLDMGILCGVTLWAWRTAPWNGDAQPQIGQYRQYLRI